MTRINIRNRSVALYGKAIWNEIKKRRFSILVSFLMGTIVVFSFQTFDTTDYTGLLDDVPVPAAESKSEPKDTKTPKPKQHHHHCLNEDFRPQHPVGVWTMLNDNMDYVQGAAKLGLGVRRHTKTPLDLVVLELHSKPLGDDMWELLRPAGFLKCSVERIQAPHKTRGDLSEKFAVLHVWAMEVYQTVVFLDADTYVAHSLDGLIGMDIQGKPLGVTKDIRGGKWVETFNSGVMLLHPNAQEHDRLVQLLYSGMEFEYIMSDQGFLNEVYKDNWHEIGFVNNANLALYKFKRDFWESHKPEDINVIHYTMQKPWKCKPKGTYGPLCKLWKDAFADDHQ